MLKDMLLAAMVSVISSLIIAILVLFLLGYRLEFNVEPQAPKPSCVVEDRSGVSFEVLCQKRGVMV